MILTTKQNDIMGLKAGFKPAIEAELATSRRSNVSAINNH